METMNFKYKFLLTPILFLPFFINSQNFDLLKAPDGFEISIFADGLESPRQITETKKGFIIVGSKNGNKIFALSDSDNDGYAETKMIVASGLQNPTGVTYHNGDLYFAEIEEVWVIRDIDKQLLEGSNIPKAELYINDLPSETWHGFRHLSFGPDNNLYIPIGVPCNVCLEPQSKDKRFAAIHKYENDMLVMVADGVRNSVGMDWHPVTNLSLIHI